LRNHGDLNRFLQIAAEAFSSTERKNGVGLKSELIRHGPEVLWFSLRERAARRRQAAQVSGLAQIDHELFRCR
jgi:hypothetical protein